MVAKANIKATFQYKQISPELARVKTMAILRILEDALRRQSNRKEQECGECLTKA